MTATNDYSNWHPGQKVAQAAAAMHTPRTTVALPPRSPNMPPRQKRPTPEPRTPEEQHACEIAARQTCPEGFGNRISTQNHWLPGTLTGCARCGKEAKDIVNPTLTP